MTSGATPINALFTMVAKLAGELFSRWLEKLNLKKQGAGEQRERDQKDANEKLRKAIDIRNRKLSDESTGVRDEDFRD